VLALHTGVIDAMGWPALVPRLASLGRPARGGSLFFLVRRVDGARPAKGRRSSSHVKPGVGLLCPQPGKGEGMCAVFAMRKLSLNTQNGMSGHGVRWDPILLCLESSASLCLRTCIEGPNPAKDPLLARRTLA
jgi:hypothetical protein